MPKPTRTNAFPTVIVGLAMAVAFAACDNNADPADRSEPLAYGVRDSAGVAIAESARPARDSRLGWTFGAEPQVSFGVAVGGAEPPLYQVGDATRLPDGRIVVANGGSNQLLVFDGSGNYLAAWAAQGDGPGEFRSLASVHRWAGDSLIAADSDEGRVSAFDLEGNHGRTTTLRGAAGGLRRSISDDPVGHTVLDVLPDHSMLTRSLAGYEATGLWRWDHAYALIGAHWGDGISLGEYPGPEIYSDSYREGRMIYVMPLRHPFGKNTFTAVWGDLVAIGGNETYEIRAFAGDGSLRRIVRRDWATGTPTQEQLDALFRESFADLPDDERASRLEFAAKVPLVETFPAYAGLEADALGYLWVREYDPPGTGRETPLWTVFDPDGRARGFVETPSGLTIYEIGEDYVLGKRTADLDVESVELWTLAR